MKRQFSRRGVIGVMFCGAIAVVSPIAVGVRSSIGRRSPRLAQSTNAPQSTAAQVQAAGLDPLRQAFSAERITFSGLVDKTVGGHEFVGSSKRFKGVIVDLSVASPIYPLGHMPRDGDDFHSRGHWRGAIGQSVWQVEFIDYNIRRIRGQLARTTSSDPEVAYSLTDVPTGKTWLLVFRASEISHFTVGTTSPQPTASALELPEGTAVELIGYEDRHRVIIATWLEVAA